MKYLLTVLSAFILFGCSSKEVKKEFLHVDDRPVVIDDLVNIPQNVAYYCENLEFDNKLYDIQKTYEKDYFSIWNIEKHQDSLESVKWPFDLYKVGTSYGENLQLLEKKFFDDMYDNSNFDTFATVNKKAITLKHSNIRLFPTIRPLLRDPSLAGEGFPFDYLQNSSIHANKPIFVSHYSKDGEWVYIFSSFASGWIKSRDIVFLDKKYTDKWQKARQVFLTKENVSIYSVNGFFLFKSKVGMMLPLVDEDENSYTVLCVSKYQFFQPMFVKAKISKNISSNEILNFNKNNIVNVISEVSNSNYGWGGLYGQRDCSSTLRDLFIPFGIWLPRNSYQQSKIGKVINLEGLSDDEKIALIKDKAVAFQTLLYKRGHIVLYAGLYNDDIVIFHNTWGIKTLKDDSEGRIVIGKSIFSSLELGNYQEHYDESASILKNLKSMNILTN